MKTALDEAFILERLPVRASWACVQAYGRHVPRHRSKALVEAVLTGTGTTTLLRPALAEKADQIPKKTTFFGLQCVLVAPKNRDVWAAVCRPPSLNHGFSIPEG